MTTAAAGYYEVLTGPTDGGVISLAEFKEFARITHDDEDSFLTTLIETATDLVERYTNRWLLTRTARASWPVVCFKGFTSGPFVEIRKAPLQSVEQVETYTRNAFETTTDFVLQQTNSYGRIIFENAFTSLYALSSYGDAQPYVVRANFTAGYGAVADVPDTLKHAVKIIAMYFWENRGDCTCSADADVSQFPMEARLALGKYRIIPDFG